MRHEQRSVVVIRAGQADRDPRGQIEWCSSEAGWRSLQIRHYVHDRTGDGLRTAAYDGQLIALVTKGSTLMQSFGSGRWRSAQLVPGCIGMTAPHETSLLRWHGPRAHETLHLRLPGPLVETALADLRETRSGVCSLPNDLSQHDSTIEAVMRSLVFNAREGASDLYAESAGYFLVRHLVAPEFQRRGRARHAHESVRLKRVEDFMREHLHEDVSLLTLAAVARCSSFHLIRICRAGWNETPYQRLSGLRMNRACELLHHTDKSIISIALECGYGNPSHFATAFRRIVGLSPSNYRRGR